MICLALLYILLVAQKNRVMDYNRLTNAEREVIINKGTERAFIGKYTNNKELGLYVCKQCDAPLYKSEHKFESSCGWPSFDDEIKGAVKRIPDKDGRRTEIVCANCGGHLGHIFFNEGLTPKMVRHCVNSISMNFIPQAELPAPVIISERERATAYFASGCFWGTEYYFSRLTGVDSTTVGFMGGTLKNPTYRDVCTKKTGHVECCKVLYDPSKISYEELVKFFFETHDFTQTDGQGPDIGPQYLSVIFYQSDEEYEIAKKIILELTLKGYKVATQLRPSAPFYRAEEYHQRYYEIKGTTPYCHKYTQIF